MPETPGSSGDEPPRAGTASRSNQPASPADVLLRRTGLSAIFQNETAMSKHFDLRREIGMLRDGPRDHFEQICTTMIRKKRSCACESMTSAILTLLNLVKSQP
jgi:hypothetical protein